MHFLCLQYIYYIYCVIYFYAYSIYNLGLYSRHTTIWKFMKTNPNKTWQSVLMSLDILILFPANYIVVSFANSAGWYFVKRISGDEGGWYFMIFGYLMIWWYLMIRRCRMIFCKEDIWGGRGVARLMLRTRLAPLLHPIETQRFVSSPIWFFTEVFGLS